jgi:hypothetical protein
MITNKKIKTAPESIHYLNEVVLGMSSSNGVIAKDYTGTKPLQDRVSDLETYGVPVELINEINTTVSQLEAIVEQYLDDPTGWVELTTIPNPDGSLYIKRIGKIINIQGHFTIENYSLIITTLPAEFVPNRYVLLNIDASNEGEIYGAEIHPQTGNIVSYYQIPIGTRVAINATYML